jgi:hypothetical protein
VIAPVQRGDRVVHIGLDVLDGQPGRPGSAPGHGQVAAREVQPRGPGALLGEGEGLDAVVALEVQYRPPLQRAQLLPLARVEAGVGRALGQAVAGAAGVHPGPGVPVAPVLRDTAPGGRIKASAHGRKCSKAPGGRRG